MDPSLPAPAAGLTEAEVVARRERHGPNRLEPRPPVPAWKRLAVQMTHFFARMLWVAAGLAFVSGMPQLGVAIALVVVLNGVFAFAQEHRAEQAARHLQSLLPARATVRRGGITRIVDAADLVPGDVVLLEAGDRISADLTLRTVRGLAVDASMLTGESVPGRPAAGESVHAGCFVVEGEAECTVAATGIHTRLASIAALTTSRHHPPTPLAREIERLVRTVAVVAGAVGIGLFAVAAGIGLPMRDGFLFGIGVMVALVPEGLLPTVTLALAMGARRMAERHALVRRLEAVETLGAATFICTDKTGTLTRNEMTAVAVWAPAGVTTVHGEGYGPDASVDGTDGARAAAVSVAVAGVACGTGHAVLENGAWIARGDPMEAALDALLRRLDGEPMQGDEQRREPFDPHRRRMSVVRDQRVLVKGAPDAVLPRCRSVDAGAGDWLTRSMDDGLRVLAVATRPATGSDLTAARDALESDLELVGLVGLLDPPRPGAAEAIARSRRAGIRVAMITGDHAGTAKAIARAVGLSMPGAPVLRGDELPADDDALAERVDHDGAVFCRIDPETKLRIARALQQRGHVVAMTGDGVNDGPALRQADIGVAMGRSGTDVAREAADLVLLDDDFSTIVVAIEHGRAAFANIRRFLTYHLTDNVAELAPFVVWALSAGRVPLALSVLQVLCLDLVTDQFPALALGMEPARPAVMDMPPANRHLVDRSLLLRALVVLGTTEALAELAVFASMLEHGARSGLPSVEVVRMASGAAFATVVLAQAANAFACRSSVRPFWALRTRDNLAVVWAVGVAAAVLGVSLAVPAVARVLGQQWPGTGGLLRASLAIPAVLVVDAAWKRFGRARTPEPARATG